MQVRTSFTIRLMAPLTLLLALGYSLAAPNVSLSRLTTTGLLAADPPVIQTPTDGYWQTECVECPKWFENMTDRSLRLDADERPRIAYGGDHLYYVRHDGASVSARAIVNGQPVYLPLIVRNG